MFGNRAALVESAIFVKPAEITGDPSRTSARVLPDATDRTVCSNVPARASRICISIPNALAACSAAETWDFPVSGVVCQPVVKGPIFGSQHADARNPVGLLRGSCKRYGKGPKRQSAHERAPVRHSMI